MNWITRFYYSSRRWLKAGRLFLAIAGPGIVVMIADNDAGGITTYAATGAKFQYGLIWFFSLSSVLSRIISRK
jgi:Mn2+/Fe2+ NRAMP family transporter